VRVTKVFRAGINTASICVTTVAVAATVDFGGVVGFVIIR